MCKLLTQYVEVCRSKCIPMHVTGITLHHHEIIPSIGAEFAYICDCERRVVITDIATKTRISIWNKISTIYTDSFNDTQIGILHLIISRERNEFYDINANAVVHLLLHRRILHFLLNNCYYICWWLSVHRKNCHLDIQVHWRGDVRGRWHLWLQRIINFLPFEWIRPTQDQLIVP